MSFFAQETWQSSRLSRPFPPLPATRVQLPRPSILLFFSRILSIPMLLPMLSIPRRLRPCKWRFLFTLRRKLPWNQTPHHFQQFSNVYFLRRILRNSRFSSTIRSFALELKYGLSTFIKVYFPKFISRNNFPLELTATDRFDNEKILNSQNAEPLLMKTELYTKSDFVYNRLRKSTEEVYDGKLHTKSITVNRTKHEWNIRQYWKCDHFCEPSQKQ